MTLKSLAQSVAAMTPGPWTARTYQSGMADIETESGIMVSGDVNSDVASMGGKDAAGIVALRNHADALIACAALLREARASVDVVVQENAAKYGDGLMHMQKPAINLLNDIDAALARLEGSEK